MSDPKDRAPKTPPPADDGRRSGRAGVDERGNSVWEWKLETGVYSRDISTQKLRKLDLGDLSIATGAFDRAPADKEKPAPKPAGGGFNPYNSAGSDDNAGGNPYDNARNTARQTQTQSPPGTPPARKPMDLKRLEEWMQIRKRLEQQKKDDDED